MTGIGAVIVAATAAFVFTAATHKTAVAGKENSHAEAWYETPEFILTCDTLAQAENVAKIVQVSGMSSVYDAMEKTNTEMGQVACSFSRLRYNSIAPVEQFPDEGGMAVYKIFKFSWVTSYQLESEEPTDWTPTNGGPVDQYVIMPFIGPVM